jgi:hypothetical protein
MNLFLLDAGGAGLVLFAYGLIFLFMFLAIMLEAAVMILMKYNIRFKKAFLDSLVVNVVSLAAGAVLLEIFPEFFNGYTVLNFIILYVVTVLIEYGLLYLLNRKHRNTDTLKVSVVMNLVTYLVLALIVGLN